MSQRSRKLLTYGKSARVSRSPNIKEESGADVFAQHQYTENAAQPSPHKGSLVKCSTGSKARDSLRSSGMRKTYAPPSKRRKIFGVPKDQPKKTDEVGVSSHQPIFDQRSCEALSDSRPKSRSGNNTSDFQERPKDFCYPRTPEPDASLVPSQDKNSHSPSANRKRLVDLLATNESSSPVEKGSLPTNPVARNGSNISTSTKPNTSHREASRYTAHSSLGANVGDSHESPTLTSANLRSPGVTYARQRSFLDQIPGVNGVGDEAYPVSSNEDHCLEQLPTSTQSLPSPFIVEEDDFNGAGPVRSIHELRQAGGNARFVGSVDSIFEEIDDPHNTQSGRCQGLIQLCTRLLDTQFARGFLEAGFDKRLSESFDNRLDFMPASFALCAYELICLHGPLSSAVLPSFWSGIIAMAPLLLEKEDDVLTLSKKHDCGLSKAVQASVRSLFPRLCSSLSAEQTSFRLSPRLLVLRCLRVTMSNFRDLGERNIDGIPLPLLTRLVNLTLLEGHAETGDCTLSAEGVQILSLVFPVLEAYTLLSRTLTDDCQNAIHPLSRLYNLLALNEYSDRRGRQLPVLYMRVILNITNNNPSLSSDFATPQLVSRLIRTAVSDFRDMSKGLLSEEIDFLDTAILALGSLINLTEASEESRRLFLKSDPVSQSPLRVFLHFFASSVGSAQEVSQNRLQN